MSESGLRAVLRSACPPDEERRGRLETVLSKKYGKSVELVWREDRSIAGGFRIEIGGEVIDWTTGGRLEQLKEKLSALTADGGSVIPLVRDTVREWVPEVLSYEVGTVLRVGDGIATVEGLEGAAYGEILLFEGGVRRILPSGRWAASFLASMNRCARGAPCAARAGRPASARARAFSAAWSMRLVRRSTARATSTPRHTGTLKAQRRAFSTARA